MAGSRGAEQQQAKSAALIHRAQSGLKGVGLVGVSVGFVDDDEYVLEAGDISDVIFSIALLLNHSSQMPIDKSCCEYR